MKKNPGRAERRKNQFGKNVSVHAPGFRLFGGTPVNDTVLTPGRLKMMGLSKHSEKTAKITGVANVLSAVWNNLIASKKVKEEDGSDGN